MNGWSGLRVINHLKRIRILKQRADVVCSEYVCSCWFHFRSQSERLAIKAMRHQCPSHSGLRRSICQEQGPDFFQVLFSHGPTAEEPLAALKGTALPLILHTPLVNSQWPHLVQCPLIFMRGELLAGAQGWQTGWPFRGPVFTVAVRKPLG